MTGRGFLPVVVGLLLLGGCAGAKPAPGAGAAPREKGFLRKLAEAIEQPSRRELERQKALEAEMEKAIEAAAKAPPPRPVLEPAGFETRALLVESPEAAKASKPDPRAQALERQIQEEIARQKQLMDRVQELRAELAKAQGSRGTPAKPPALLGGARGTPDKEGFVPVYEGGRLVRRERDAAGLGTPDVILYYDDRGRLVRREEDTRRRGRIDVWSYYDRGDLIRRELDGEGTGQIDTWEYYERGRLARIEKDTDHDGRVDVISTYEKNQLLKAETLGRDGLIVKTVYYRKGRPYRMEEDTEGGGRVDRVTYYDADGRMIKQERDTKGTGRPNIWDYYEPKTGALVKQEEDLKGEGRPTIASFYEGGRVVRRQFFDVGEEAGTGSKVPEVQVPVNLPNVPEAAPPKTGGSATFRSREDAGGQRDSQR